MHQAKYCAALAIIVVIAAAISLLPSTPAQAAGSSPIKIEQCFVTTPKLMRKTASGTQIVYVNEGTKTATSVTFAVGYRNAQSSFLRKVTDVGSFAPGAKINHHFKLYSDVTYSGKQTHSCAAVAVKWSNGTRWVSGH